MMIIWRLRHSQPLAAMTSQLIHDCHAEEEEEEEGSERRNKLLLLLLSGRPCSSLRVRNGDIIPLVEICEQQQTAAAAAVVVVGVRQKEECTANRKNTVSWLKVLSYFFACLSF
jgi:hypothetical protein